MLVTLCPLLCGRRWAAGTILHYDFVLISLLAVCVRASLNWKTFSYSKSETLFTLRSVE